MVDEANGLEGAFDRWQVVATDQDIDVFCKANGFLIDPAHPFRDSIAAHHRIRDAGIVECFGRSAHALFNFFSCHERSFPAADYSCWIRHFSPNTFRSQPLSNRLSFHPFPIILCIFFKSSIRAGE